MADRADLSERLPRRARILGYVLLVSICALLALNVLWIIRHVEALRALGPGAKAPDFDLTSIQGERVRLSDLQGRVVLLEFWSVSCPPCHRALRHLGALRRRLPSDRVVLLAIHVQGGERARAAAAHTAARLGLRLPVLLDPGGRVSERYTVRALPTTVLVDRRGQVRKVWRGVTGSETLSAAIREHL